MRWMPGLWLPNNRLVLHEYGGRGRQEVSCTRDQFARVLDALTANRREALTMDQITTAIEGKPALDALRALHGERPHEERPHSAIGASGFSRWSVCPGSVALSKDLPSRDSDYSIEGTAAHWVGEQAFRHGQEAWEYAGQKAPNGVEVDEEMVDGVQMWLDTINGDLAAYAAEGHDDAKIFLEHQFSLEALGVSDAFGTADMAIWFPAWALLRVYDFKYGAGIVVEVEGNGQVRYYATGVLLDLPALIGHQAHVEEVETIIVQPRCEHDDGYVRRERLTVDELNAWVESDLLPAIERTSAPDAPLVEGPHCRFCPVKAALACPLLDQLKNQLATTAEQTPDAALEARGLDDWELAERMARVAPVEMYIRALKDEAYVRLQKGLSLPGWKLVPKKANRVLKDGAEASAKEKWGDDAYTDPVLKSAAQLEKLKGGKAWAAEWAFKPDAGVTLAPDTDKREGVKVRTVKEIFAAAIEGGD